jgi:hypothetical protein
MDTILDIQKVQQQLDRAAREATHGSADIRAGRFVHGNPTAIISAADVAANNMSNTEQTFSTISTLDDYPETARLLGTLTVAWSHAERILYFAFWVASETTQQKAFELYETLPNFRARYDLAIALLKQDQANHPKFSDLILSLQTLVQCFQVRNELVHRTWAKSEDGTLALLDHRLNKKVPQLRSIKDDEIRATIKLINESCDKVIKAIMEIYPHAFKPV